MAPGGFGGRFETRYDEGVRAPDPLERESFRP